MLTLFNSDFTTDKTRNGVASWWNIVWFVTFKFVLYNKNYNIWMNFLIECRQNKKYFIIVRNWLETPLVGLRTLENNHFTRKFYNLKSWCVSTNEIDSHATGKPLELPFIDSRIITNQA